MASEVEICNRALQKLGAKRITSMTQDAVNARACNVAYEVIRDRLLRSHNWVFSIKRAELAADATAPDWGRANAFQLPSDFIKMAPVYPEDNSNDRDWTIEGRKIYTNAGSPLYIRYVRQVTDPNQMDTIFRELVAVDLAFEICEEITQSTTKKEGLRTDRKEVLIAARKANAYETLPAEPAEDIYLSCRR